MQQVIYVGRLKTKLTTHQQKNLLEFIFAQVIRESIRLYYKHLILPKGLRQILLILPKRPRDVDELIVQEANKFAISLVKGCVGDVKTRDMHKAIFAVIITACAEIVNHCAVYTPYYSSSVLGHFAESFFRKYTKGLDEKSKDEIQYENYPQLANIVRGFVEGDLIEVIQYNQSIEQ